MKVISIVGTRPQFIKLVPLAIRFSYTNTIDHVIINTGQHFDEIMSDIFLKLLPKKPKYNLNINTGSHGENTGKMIIEIEKILLDEKPDFVIVFGDCDTTLAGCIAASKLPTKLVHIESGCRSNLRYQPEEVNRKMVDSIADILFCVTPFDMNNLKKEGKENIYFCGHLHKELVDYVNKKNIKEEHILMTLHRKENLQVEKLNNLFKELQNHKILFLIHPRTKKFIDDKNIKVPENIKVTDPVDYQKMIELINKSSLIVTDSGGIRFEAFYLNKKCIILRKKDECEWKELEDLGFIKHVDENIDYHIQNFKPNFINKNKIFYDEEKDPSEIILDVLKSYTL